MDALLIFFVEKYSYSIVSTEAKFAPTKLFRYRDFIFKNWVGNTFLRNRIVNNGLLTKNFSVKSTSVGETL